MTTPIQAGSPVSASSPISGLAEAIDSILDKGLVIDAFARVSVIGIEVLTIEARIAIASVDTYLQFAQAVSQLTAPAQDNSRPLLESQRQTRHATEGPVGPTALSASGIPANGTPTRPSPSG